jgi:hypothetical protein
VCVCDAKQPSGAQKNVHTNDREATVVISGRKPILTGAVEINKPEEEVGDEQGGGRAK